MQSEKKITKVGLINCPETLFAEIVPMSKNCGYTKAICPQLQGKGRKVWTVIGNKKL